MFSAPFGGWLVSFPQAALQAEAQQKLDELIIATKTESAKQTEDRVKVGAPHCGQCAVVVWTPSCWVLL
jgi:hypothetical protein